MNERPVGTPMENRKVLHVLTLIEGQGEYGGPVTVARTFRDASKGTSFELKLLGGTRVQVSSKLGLEIGSHAVLVKAIIKKYSISSSISLKMVTEIMKSIQSSQIIHLHFARDLIQILSGFFCILARKPFFIQTHGMIRRKNSWISKLFDFLLVIPIIKRAQLCFVLTEAEGKDLKKVYAQAKTYILRNGYDFDKWSLVRNDDSNKIRVVFCSRLHATKGVRHFCELAKHYSNDKRYVFEIYGPDGGELFWIENFLKDYPGDNLIYRGSVSSSEVLGILSKSDLLVLPSTYDPYPMIILEALCTGTPLLVNSVCGQSSELSNIYPSYVYKGQDSVSLIQAFKKLEPIKTDLNVRTQIRSSCRNIFGIESVWENLRKCYEQTTEMRSGGK